MKSRAAILRLAQQAMRRWEQVARVRSETFPEQKIRRAWDDGMHVQAVAHGDGVWLVIFSQRQ